MEEVIWICDPCGHAIQHDPAYDEMHCAKCIGWVRVGGPAFNALLDGVSPVEFIRNELRNAA